VSDGVRLLLFVSTKVGTKRSVIHHQPNICINCDPQKRRSYCRSAFVGALCMALLRHEVASYTAGRGKEAMIQP
jgi:hypothetical protein